MNRLMIVFLLGIATALGGCVNPPPRPNDPYYVSVLPRTPLPATQNNDAIYQAGFEQNLYDDRKTFRVDDIVTITLSEKTQASKEANSDIQEDSKAKMGLTSLFGSGMATNNPIGSGDLSLSAEYDGSRDARGGSQAGRSSSLTDSITMTVAEVLPNGILSVHGEKRMTLSTGNELVHTADLIRADDIAAGNTMSSTRVVDARITCSGTDAFADASQPG